MDIEPVVGASFEYAFSFTQEQVEKFAELTGDNNPLHLDAEYAATTPFKRPIIHGMLSATVFTKNIRYTVSWFRFGIRKTDFRVFTPDVCGYRLQSNIHDTKHQPGKASCRNWR